MMENIKFVDADIYIYILLLLELKYQSKTTLTEGRYHSKND